MPAEPPAVFGDALRRLATAATYLYEDNARYWFATQPTVTKLAGRSSRADAAQSGPRSAEIGHACGPTCAGKETSAGCTPCRIQARTCPTTWTHGLS